MAKTNRKSEEKASGSSLRPQKKSSSKLRSNKSAKPTKSPQTMEELLSVTGYTLRGFKKGQVVEGAITRISPKEVTVDISGKTEGVVIDRELENYRDMLHSLKIGDRVVAQVIVAENDRGQAVLSLRRHLTEKRWHVLVEKQKKGDRVEVIVRESVRGGVLAEYGGLRGYIPLSQLDPTTTKQLDKVTGRKMQVKVLEVDQATNRLVFSERAIAEEAVLAAQKEIMSAVSLGATVESTISHIAPFGAFAKFTVEKDGEKKVVEGLIHISEIAWEKVEDPSQYLKAGDTLKVKVIGLDEKTGKVNLSIKQLLPDPWEHVLDMFEKDSEVKGKVTRATPYGVFVELSPGVEGLIHISKLAPGEEPKAGDEITCIVEDIKPDQRKISLSMTLKEKPIGYR